MSSAASPFISGIITMGFLVACLLFLRFWTRTCDRLLATFAAAFMLLATNQALVALVDAPREERSWISLLRVAAFGLIVAAVVWKNRNVVAPWNGRH